MIKNSHIKVKFYLISWMVIPNTRISMSVTLLSIPLKWNLALLRSGIIGFFLISNATLMAQHISVNREHYQIKMNMSGNPIVLDGILDDPAWQTAQIAKNFHRVLPTDEGHPISDTEVMMAHDDNNLYLAVTCLDSIPGKRPVESLRRDFSFGRNDNFIVFIDTYNDQTNGFAFGISAVGAQWEGIQADGGFVSLNWDTKWSSAVKNYPDRWIAEFSIPFKSIRYKEGATEWGINFSRLDLKTGEKSSWAPVPRQFQTANLAFTGLLRWDKPLPKRGIHYSVIPYLFAQSTKNHQLNKEAELIGKVGLDAKLIVSTSLNLDVTVNPDFSTVDVDQQQINLDRFELFFPERRQFFLENSDLFASLGEEDNRPFFSRRIGLNNPVRAGARLSGKLGSRARIGVMNLQTGTEGDVFGSNFAVGVFQQQIFSRSNVTFFMVNKQVTDEEFLGEDRYNRVLGLDVNLFSSDSRWTGKIFYHHALYPGRIEDAFTLSGKVVYDTPKLTLSLSQSYIGDDYNAEVGFILRKGVNKIAPQFQYRFFPQASKIANHGPDIDMEIFLDKDFVLLDRNNTISYSMTWLDRSTLTLSLMNSTIRLRNDFSPTGEDELLPAGSRYQWTRAQAAYQSNPRSLFSYTGIVGYGGHFNGHRFQLSSELAFRVQPYGYIGLISSYNHIQLPDPYGNAEFILLGPKLDITFTDKIFLTTFTQFNNQLDNMNVNIRFQWRYAPGSDFFIVYTQNNYPDGFEIKNQGIAAKILYWFN